MVSNVSQAIWYCVETISRLFEQNENPCIITRRYKRRRISRYMACSCLRAVQQGHKIAYIRPRICARFHEETIFSILYKFSFIFYEKGGHDSPSYDSFFSEYLDKMRSALPSLPTGADNKWTSFVSAGFLILCAAIPKRFEYANVDVGNFLWSGWRLRQNEIQY